MCFFINQDIVISQKGAARAKVRERLQLRAGVFTAPAATARHITPAFPRILTSLSPGPLPCACHTACRWGLAHRRRSEGCSHGHSCRSVIWVCVRWCISCRTVLGPPRWPPARVSRAASRGCVSSSSQLTTVYPRRPNPRPRLLLPTPHDGFMYVRIVIQIIWQMGRDDVKISLFSH